MSLKIAIQPDEIVHPNGKHQSFSERWIELARAQDIDAITVDAFSHDALAQIATCDAFMWRYPSSARARACARRLMYAVEAGLGMPVFPSLKSSWYFEDKLAQYYFFCAAGIPSARTEIFWTRGDAERFCDRATYPFVLKLAGGHQSSNVRLVRKKRDALFYVDELFGHGVPSLGYGSTSRPRLLLRRLRAAGEVVESHNPYGSTAEAEVQYGYFYAQEFLPDNECEISAIIIGNRAFAARRFNRPGDFRTRGSSSRMDWSPDAIGEDAIRLAYRVKRALNAQTVAVDILRRRHEPIIIELTVNYASWVVHQCPGHWILHGNPMSAPLVWLAGPMRAEDAVFEDFLGEVRGTRRSASQINIENFCTDNSQ